MISPALIALATAVLSACVDALLGAADADTLAAGRLHPRPAEPVVGTDVLDKAGRSDTFRRDLTRH